MTPVGHPPLSRVQQVLVAATCTNVVTGWTYMAQTTPTRERLLGFIGFSPQLVGLLLVGLGLVGLVITLRGRKEFIAWAAVSSGPILLTIMWTFAAIIHTPPGETAHVFATLMVIAATGFALVRWARGRTGRLLGTVSVGVVLIAIMTHLSTVSAWSAWSFALLYLGFWVLLYLAALATTPTRWHTDD